MQGFNVSCIFIQLMKTTQLSAPEAIQQTASAIQLRLINHRISAGFPSPATDYAEEGLDLNE